jgi:hypothetical protein
MPNKHVIFTSGGLNPLIQLDTRLEDFIKNLNQSLQHTICQPRRTKPWLNTTATQASQSYHEALQASQKHPHDHHLKHALLQARHTRDTAIRNSHTEYIHHVIDEMNEAAHQHNITAIFRALDRLDPYRHRHLPSILIDTVGTTHNDPKSRAKLFASHFHDTLNKPSPETPPLAPTHTPDLPSPWLPVTITKEEIEIAVNQLHNGRCADADHLKAEHLKLGGEPMINNLYKIIHEVTTLGHIPSSWYKVHITPVPKTGRTPQELREVPNWRPIGDSAMFLKVLARTLLTRLQDILAPQIHAIQAGFRRHRSITEHVFSILRTMEKRKMEHKDLHLTFLDIKSAYDSIDRSTLWILLRDHYKVPAELVHLLETLYAHTEGQVFVEGDSSDPFSLQSGLKQGCLLSPLLFIVYLDYIIRQIMPVIQDLGIKWTLDSGDTFDMVLLFYADDGMIIAPTYEATVFILNLLNTTLRRFNLVISASKTKYMPCSFTLLPTASDPLILDGQLIETVKSFRYLGTIIQADASMDLNTKRRIGLAWTAFWKIPHIWRDPHISHATKSRLYKACILPTLLHGAESWIPSASMISKLTKFQHSALLIIDNTYRIAHITAETLRHRYDVLSIPEYLRTARLREEGHLLRTPLPDILQHPHQPTPTLPHFHDIPIAPVILRSLITYSDTPTSHHPYPKIIHADHIHMSLPHSEIPDLADHRTSWRKSITPKPPTADELKHRHCPFCDQYFETPTICYVHILNSPICRKLHPRMPDQDNQTVHDMQESLCAYNIAHELPHQPWMPIPTPGSHYLLRGRSIMASQASTSGPHGGSGGSGSEH